MTRKINYGKYTNLPLTLMHLSELDRRLEKEGYSLDMDLSLILDTERIAYDCTPCDVITFASIGADGIHYGLLTDFGTVENLEEAFVICISPMDYDNPFKIVARNLREFVRLVCTLRDASIISNFQYFEEEEDYHECLEEFADEIDEEYAARNSFIINQLKTAVEGPLIEDIYDYVERQVKKERENQIILHTMDGLGIRSNQPKITKHRLYKLEKDMNVNLPDVRNFFGSASLESKLAFIREAQFTYLLMDEPELKKFLIKEMQSIGLTDEAERLKYTY